jgi:hypothetical protein
VRSGWTRSASIPGARRPPCWPMPGDDRQYLCGGTPGGSPGAAAASQPVERPVRDTSVPKIDWF